MIVPNESLIHLLEESRTLLNLSTKLGLDKLRNHVNVFVHLALITMLYRCRAVIFRSVKVACFRVL